MDIEQAFNFSDLEGLPIVEEGPDKKDLLIQTLKNKLRIQTALIEYFKAVTLDSIEPSTKVLVDSLLEQLS